LVSDCRTRIAATIPIEAITDTVPPAVLSSDRSCGRDFLLSLSDYGSRYSGISSISFDTLINARVVGQSPSDLATPTSLVETRLTTIDPYRDMIYQVRCVDAAGNIQVWRDTIGGFTITALDDARDSVSQRFDRDLTTRTMLPGEERCDSVLIVNYGSRPVTLTRLSFSGNRSFSVPPSQMPFVIAPNSERRLSVCLEALSTGISVDTMRMVDNCGRGDGLILKSQGSILASRDGCNSALSVTSLGASKRTFMMAPHPNPNDGASAAVDIGLSTDASITLELLDGNGVSASTVMSAVDLRAGLHRIAFDVSVLGSGTYYCRLRTASGAQYVEKLVIRR
ncbi:MAG: T9SS type A sorting domain-containing protein, partial [bacterium]|nr:T9SS type A sorting domain-containing protein [Candidatus Kapabacteria bacterium]